MKGYMLFDFHPKRLFWLPDKRLTRPNTEERVQRVVRNLRADHPSYIFKVVKHTDGWFVYTRPKRIQRSRDTNY